MNDQFLEFGAQQDDLLAGQIRFQVVCVFLVLAHDRRRMVHYNVTGHPTAEWTAQLLREAFPFDQFPRYLLRDRDGVFGAEVNRQVADLGMEEVLGAPRAPRQRAYVEREEQRRTSVPMLTLDNRGARELE